MTTLVRCLIDCKSEIDLPRLALRDDLQRVFVIERQTEFACEDVSRSARDDGESGVRACETLDRFVDRAVTARDDHVRSAVASRTRRDLGGVAGTLRQFQIDLDPERFELCSELLNRSPPRSVATRFRI